MTSHSSTTDCLVTHSTLVSLRVVTDEHRLLMCDIYIIFDSQSQLKKYSYIPVLGVVSIAARLIFVYYLSIEVVKNTGLMTKKTALVVLLCFQ